MTPIPGASKIKPKMNVYQEFEWRGMIYATTPGLEDLLAQQKVTAYIGFDPSAPSLHVGSLLQIMTLVHLQRHGHTPLALIGGGTGLIGDPSGRTEERPLLAKERAQANAEEIEKQLSRFLDRSSKTNPAIFANNADWLCSINLVDFLRDVGKYFTVNYMLAKESVRRRLEEGLSFTEFSYMLLQAYDFLVLHDRYGCLLQLGGSDQWGNITAGIDLIRRLRGKTAHGMVTPLIETASGTKFGKTESGTVWLDAKLTSPYHFYQFWINVDDRDVIQYLKFFTLLSQEEIAELERSLAEAPERREAQRRLAQEVTRLVHGEELLRKAERASAVLFGKEIEGLTAQDILEIFGDVPSTEVPLSRFGEDGLLLVDVVTECGLASSKSEARRLIKEGGLYLNNRRVSDVYHKLSLAEGIEGQIFILRRGAKQYHLIRVVPQA